MPVPLGERARKQRLDIALGEGIEVGPEVGLKETRYPVLYAADSTRRIEFEPLGGLGGGGDGHHATCAGCSVAASGASSKDGRLFSRAPARPPRSSIAGSAK